MNWKCPDCEDSTLGRCQLHASVLVTDWPPEITEVGHQHHYVPYPERQRAFADSRKIYCEGCGDVKPV